MVGSRVHGCHVWACMTTRGRRGGHDGRCMPVPCLPCVCWTPCRAWKAGVRGTLRQPHGLEHRLHPHMQPHKPPPQLWTGGPLHTHRQPQGLEHRLHPHILGVLSLGAAPHLAKLRRRQGMQKQVVRFRTNWLRESMGNEHARGRSRQAAQVKHIGQGSARGVRRHTGRQAGRQHDRARRAPPLHGTARLAFSR